ncbi:MAG: beta-galactosidase, partial [bacterium]|nr:beta-galactosidase [bacterium]
MPPRRRRSTPESAEPAAEATGQPQDNAAGFAGTPPAETAPAPRRRSRRRSVQNTTVEAEPAAAPQVAEETTPSATAESAQSAPQPQLPTAAADGLQQPVALADQPATTARRARRSSRRRAKRAEGAAETAAESPAEPVSEPTADVVEPPVEQVPSPAPSAQIMAPAALPEPALPEAEVTEQQQTLPEALETGVPQTAYEEEVVTPPARRRSRRTRAVEGTAEEQSVEQRRRKREGVRLGIRQGHPEIIIDGEPVVPLFFFGNIDSAASERRVCEQIRQAASAGVHLHALLLELPVSVPMVSHSVNEALRLLHLVRQHDPQGYIMFRVVFTPPPDWHKLYPEAMTTYADGSTGEPSFASERYWQEAESALTLLVRQLEVTEEARYILGYHLDCREWFYEYQRGYDYSPAAQEAFRQWLRTRYKNDVVALRAAWHDGSVNFTSASVPTYRGEASCATVLYEYRKGQRYVDYLRFASEVIARRIVTLSRIVKRACENRRLVAVSYGYVLDFAVPHSGHLALSEVLSAQSIDLICAPVSYRDRRPAQPGSVPVPVASVRLHGKLFVLEDDTKPHTAHTETPDDYNPRCQDAEATRQVRLRNATTALVHHAGISWMDLWGEGWVNDHELWQRAAKLSDLYLTHIRQRLPETPEVAVIVDERSVARIQSPRSLLEPLLIQQQEVLARAGIHYGVYLQSDLVRKA